MTIPAEVRKYLGLFYDQEGNPIEFEEWSQQWRDFPSRVIAKDRVGDFEVSTVWLGTDLGCGDGRPLIFETMVFGGPLDQECERYATRQEAVTGHVEMVARVLASARGWDAS